MQKWQMSSMPFTWRLIGHSCPSEHSEWHLSLNLALWHLGKWGDGMGAATCALCEKHLNDCMAWPLCPLSASSPQPPACGVWLGRVQGVWPQGEVG